MAREKNNLVFQGHNYQLFVDLSQSTISKRRAMKPRLLELQRNNIAYQWGLPFFLRFSHQGTRHTCRSPEELQQAMQYLNLVENPHTASTSRRRSASTSSLKISSQSAEKNGSEHLHKRSQHTSPHQEQEDCME